MTNLMEDNSNISKIRCNILGNSSKRLVNHLKVESYPSQPIAPMPALPTGTVAFPSSTKHRTPRVVISVSNYSQLFFSNITFISFLTQDIKNIADIWDAELLMNVDYSCLYITFEDGPGSRVVTNVTPYRALVSCIVLLYVPHQQLHLKSLDFIIFGLEMKIELWVTFEFLFEFLICILANLY